MSRNANPADLRPPARQRLYEQVAEQIMAWVRDNQLGPGDRLPPERDLATRLAVSRATVAQALVALEVVGVLEVRHGNGALLTDSRPATAIMEAIRRHASQLPEILDARDALETKIAALAAERRTEQDLLAIAAALQEMSREIRAGERGVHGDALFHAAVTAAAHSSLLAKMMAEIAELIVETRLESLSQPGRPQESLAVHRAIADAIKACQPKQASEAMHIHLMRVSDVQILA